MELDRRLERKRLVQGRQKNINYQRLKECKNEFQLLLKNRFEVLDGAENNIDRINENIGHAVREEEERVGVLQLAQENRKVSKKHKTANRTQKEPENNNRGGQTFIKATTEARQINEEMVEKL